MSFWSRQRTQRGAVLVHAAVALIGLIAVSAFAVDYGVMWLGRRQAQNSADSGALAGALSLAFEAPGATAVTDPPKLGARAVAQANIVFGEAPNVDPASDITIGPCPDGEDVCVRVDVYRSESRGNALPAFFAQLVGLSSQDVRATATARVLHGNVTNCLKPWAVADKWDEFDGTETEYQNRPEGDVEFYQPGSSYDRYKAPNKGPENDLYIPPSANDPGTGFRLFDENGLYCCDYGRQLPLKIGSPGNSENETYSSGWFMALRLVDSKGGADYKYNIKNCNGMTYGIGDALPLDTEQGVMQGPTTQGVETDDDSLVNKDPAAYWDQTALGGKGAVRSPKYGLNQSPRIVPIPVFNIDEYLATDPTGKSTVIIRNVLGFFVEGTCGQGNKEVCGRLVSVPGDFVQGGNTVDPTSAFLKKIMLIR